MEYSRNVLATWSIKHLAPPTDENAWVDEVEPRQKVKKEAFNLREVMKAIAEKPIVGEPSVDDPHVGAVLARLKDRLTALASMTDNSLSRELEHGRGWQVDEITKAAELASQYCDAQRDALFNKLAKASQKPDFCVKRDSVDDAATRDRYFPISESWDNDWYSGGNYGE
jgi:hypothetical protein